MTEFLVEFKLKNLVKRQSMKVVVPDDCIAEVNRTIDNQFFKGVCSIGRLDKLEGDYECDIDNAVISQIGWLLKYREVSYLYIDENGPKKKFVLGVRMKDDVMK